MARSFDPSVFVNINWIRVGSDGAEAAVSCVFRHTLMLGVCVLYQRPEGVCVCVCVHGVVDRVMSSVKQTQVC